MEHRTGELPKSRLARIGGEEAVRRLTGVFFEMIEALPEATRIRDMHQDLVAARAKMELFLIEWWGGSKEYSRVHGHPRLRLRHSRFSISTAERDAWMTCMRLGLRRIVTDTNLRQEIDQDFTRVANALVNRR